MKDYKKSPSDLLLELKRAQSNYEQLITVLDVLNDFMDPFSYGYSGKKLKAFGLSDDEYGQLQAVQEMLQEKQDACCNEARRHALKLIAA